jgi:putative membrane protein
MRTALIAGIAILIVVLIFIIQNTHAVNISFLGAQLRLSLAVALLLAAIAGALLMAAVGTARPVGTGHASYPRAPHGGQPGTAHHGCGCSPA